MSIITKFSHWEECSFNEYKQSCLNFGYNCESAPDFLNFMLRHNAPLKFYSFKRQGRVLGSVCVDNGWVANDFKNKKRAINFLPVPATSIYIPLSKDMQNAIMPFKSKCLHPLQKNAFFNTSYELFSKRRAAFAKNIENGFSKKTVSTREREIRRYIKSGGHFKPVGEISGEELFDIYNDLFQSRWGRGIAEPEINRLFFKEFQSFFKGGVMFVKGEPTAIQLLISVENRAGFFADYINIGYKKNEDIDSIGTMLMWNNLKMLNNEALSKGLDLHYSFGFMSGEYKTRWCTPAAVGRVFA